MVPAGDFNRVVREAWSAPTLATGGGESNRTAQTRALAVLRQFIKRHAGQHLVVATHGNLLALVLNGLDPMFGYEFWRQLSFQDIYELELDRVTLISVRRIWEPQAAGGP